MFGLDELKEKIVEAVADRNPKSPDDLHMIVDEFFPQKEFEQVISYLKTQKEFKNLPEERIHDFAHNKIYNNLLMAAFEEYNSNQGVFSINEIEEELNVYLQED